MRTDRTQMWESWWLVMLKWYVLMLYRIVDVVLESFMHLNCVVSSTQRWTRKLPVRGDVQMQEINVSCGLPIRQSNNDIHYSRKRSNWHDEPDFTN